MNRSIKECVRFLGKNIQRDECGSYLLEKGDFSIHIQKETGCSNCSGGWTACIETDSSYGGFSFYSKGKTLSDCERDAKKKLMPLFKQMAELLDYDVE